LDQDGLRRNEVSYKLTDGSVPTKPARLSSRPCQWLAPRSDHLYWPREPFCTQSLPKDPTCLRI